MDRAILEGITAAWPNGMIVLDQDVQVTHWNQWMERSSGVPQAAALGKKFEDLFERDSIAPRVLVAIGSALRDGTSSILTRSFTPYPLPLHRDEAQTVRMVQCIRVRSVRSNEGERFCILDIHDETASAKREALMVSQRKVLEERTEALVSANEALDAFVRHAGHDLRAPLRGIEAFSQLLRNDLGEALPQEASADLKQIDLCVSQLGNIIENILIISRTNHKDLLIESVDMEKCLDLAIESASACLVDSEFEIEREPWPKVQGDRRLLTQLLQNLVENALHHCASDGNKLQLRFTCDSGAGPPVFGIADNGPGIAKPHQEEMWTPFKSFSEEHRGAGLGLAICRSVVDRHTGRIWCDSEPGAGAHFQFTL